MTLIDSSQLNFSNLFARCCLLALAFIGTCVAAQVLERAPVLAPELVTTPAPPSASSSTLSLQQASAPKDPPAIRATALLSGETIALDPSLSHPAWLRTPAFEQFVEHSPRNGEKPERQTKVRVLFDSQALYVGIEALDPRPAEIKAVQVRHDQVFRTMDFLVLYIDAVGKKKSAQFFRVNALGAMADGLHTADDDNEDFSPDYDFTAAAQLTPNGYSGIFRIPFSSLRFDPNGKLPWRIMVGRRLPREQSILNLSVPLARDAPNFISNLQILEGFEAPKSGNFLWLRPTITARRITEVSPNKSGDNEFKASLDFKWSPRAELVIDGTVNPDFSQLELDVVELSRNNRFALFKQEKRPLFLESRDLLVTLSNSLYTRAINDPLWALRGTWRSENLSSTALITHDKGGGSIIIPGTYFSAYANQPANNTAFARLIYKDNGFSISHRDYAEDAGSNTVVSGDKNWQINDLWRAKVQALFSNTSALPDANQRLSKGPDQTGAALQSEFFMQGKDWDQSIRINYFSKLFRNDMGFINQTGIVQVGHNVTRKFNDLDIGGLIKANTLNLQLNTAVTRDLESGKMIASNITPSIYYEGARGHEINFGVHIGEATRPDVNARLLREQYFNLWSQINPNRWLTNISGYVDAGQLIDYGITAARHGQRFGMTARIRPFAVFGSDQAAASNQSSINTLDRIEIEPRFDALRFTKNGSTVVSDITARVLAIFHIAPQHSIRLINQTSRYKRVAEANYGTQDEKDRRISQSVTYIWRQSASDSLFVGASRSARTITNPKVDNREIFVKWQKQI